MTEAPQWDVFISYASEDRSPFVEPLVQVLTEFGVKPWWDQFELTVGDSLSRSIDRGLSSSKFGLIVVSSSFLTKRWPEYEYRGLVARELAGGKVILPVWYGVTVDEVLGYSPTLADKKALALIGEVNDTTLVRLCVDLIEVVRPDLLTRIHLKVAEELASRRARRVIINPSEMKTIRIAPPRHVELPPELITRIRIVRAALMGVYRHSMEFWMRGFLHDAHPTRAVGSWEKLTATYLEYLHSRSLSDAARTSVFKYLLSITNGLEDASLLDAETIRDRDLLRASRASLYPVLDISDPDIQYFENAKWTATDYSEGDVESFPDIARERIVQLADMILEDERLRRRGGPPK